MSAYDLDKPRDSRLALPTTEPSSPPPPDVSPEPEPDWPQPPRDATSPASFPEYGPPSLRSQKGDGTPEHPDTVPTDESVDRTGVAEPEPAEVEPEPGPAAEPISAERPPTDEAPVAEETEVAPKAETVGPKNTADAEPAGIGSAAVEPGRFDERWQAVQASFVDDPRVAVEQADGLVGETLEALSRRLTAERDRLSSSWPSDASTEGLRSALIGYRDLFQRLSKV